MSVAREQKEESKQEFTAFDFTLILGGVSEMTDELAEALYGHGCDDALLGSQNGEIFLDFSRESETLLKAIMTAVIAVERAGISGLKVIEVRPPDKLTIDMVNSFLELRNHVAHEATGFENQMWQLLMKADLT
ncbi:MAG: hypothetical protein WD648_04080 [Planctomycetaceae bacterium]